MHPRVNTIVIVLILIVAGILFYFFSYKKSIAPVTGTENTSQSLEQEYKNNLYGFSVSLPQSWAGYSIVKAKWEGYSLNADGTEQILAEMGPLILVRHPNWTEGAPRQDIPIMVFTVLQWQNIQADKFHIGAAPVGPSELARNSRYVFALPARYNFAYLEGFEEVDAIIQGGKVKAQ